MPFCKLPHFIMGCITRYERDLGMRRIFEVPEGCFWTLNRSDRSKTAQYAARVSDHIDGLGRWSWSSAGDL